MTALTRPGLDGARLLGQSRPEEARLALLTALSTGDESPATTINLALAEQGCGDTIAAKRRLEGAARNYPGWDEPHLRLAELYRHDGNWPAAEHSYRDALERNPERAEALVALGAGLLNDARPAEAIPLLRRACAKPNRDVQAWHALGLALMAGGDPVAAEGALARAQSLAPSQLDIVLQRTEAALAARHGDAELSRLEAWCEAEPLNALPYLARAHALRSEGHWAAATDCLEVAAQLCPTNAWTFAALGNLQAEQQQVRAAEDSLRHALDLDPGLYQARYDLAAVLIRRLRFTEAEALLEQLIAEHGPSEGLLSNLASALIGQGRQTEAVAAAQRTTNISPGSLRAWRTLTAILPYCGDVEEQLEAARSCGQRFKRETTLPLCPSADPNRPLRVAVLSNALRTHPVGWLTVAAIEALDPRSFDIVCLGPFAATDPIAARFAARASAWYDTTGLDDETVAQRARALGVDILLDLGGHGESGRLGVLACRAAPVQVKWVGAQAASTGLPEMDWFLADRWSAPAGCEPLYSEHLLRVTDGYVCYSPPTYAPAVTTLPALQTGRITFGCFNNLTKITPSVLETWAAILGQVKTARLFLKAAQLDDAVLRARFHERVTQAGLEKGRVTLAGPTSHRDHLAAYSQIDIALDPFPYSGGLSTCEAVWMGVPTITLPGRSFASRHTMSHQENAGLVGWSAANRAEYVALAVARSANLAELAALRRNLRARTAASPLCNAARFGDALGRALRYAWHERCRGSRAD